MEVHIFVVRVRCGCGTCDLRLTLILTFTRQSRDEINFWQKRNRYFFSCDDRVVYKSCIIQCHSLKVASLSYTNDLFVIIYLHGGKGDSEAAAGCTCAAVYPVAAPPAPHFLLVGNYLVFIPSVIVLPSY